MYNQRDRTIADSLRWQIQNHAQVQKLDEWKQNLKKKSQKTTGNQFKSHQILGQTITVYNSKVWFMRLILFAGEMEIESLVSVRNLVTMVFHLSTPYRGNERRQSLGTSILRSCQFQSMLSRICNHWKLLFPDFWVCIEELEVHNFIGLPATRM